MCFDGIKCYIVTAATCCDTICNDCKIAIVNYNIIIIYIILRYGFIGVTIIFHFSLIHIHKNNNYTFIIV